jgi:hypothetical protein
MKTMTTIFFLIYRRHLSILCNNLFFFTLDSEFMTIEPDQVIPWFAPANCNQTFDLIEEGGATTTHTSP